VNGGIKCIGAVDTSSDARYKTNVQPLAGALDNHRWQRVRESNPCTSLEREMI
jgi:hypothetical protein